jgi:hypothetical protein
MKERAVGASRSRLRAGIAAVLVAIASAVALWVGGAADAQGVSGYSEPTASVNVPKATTANVTATCPGGDEVVGGGYQIANAPTEHVLASGPSGNNAWVIQVENANPDTAQAAGVTAVCVAGPIPGYSQPSNSAGVSPTGVEQVAVSCPNGTVVVGGGFTNPTGVAEISSWPEVSSNTSSTTWTSIVSAPSAANIGVTAICVSSSLSGYFEQATPTSSGTVTATCPSGEVVLGGGFLGNVANTVTAQEPAAGGVVSNNSWTTTVPVPASGEVVQTLAICADLAATVSGLSPSSGPQAGGTTVTITGANLTGATAVNFGAAAAASFSVNSDTQITAKSPPGSGTVDVTVTTPSGPSPVVPTDKFTYIPPAPVVSGVSPSSGPAAGGTSVTITGTNLAGATAVDFGATAASAITSDTATQIVATAPKGSGPVDVTVSTPAGTSAAVAGDKFTYVSPPAATVPAATVGRVSTSGATLNDAVNPNGSETVVFFEYGLDPKYGAPSAETAFGLTTPAQVLAPGATPQPVMALVSGLVPNALYDARAVATNAGGTVVGPETQFTTAALPPPPAPVIGRTENITPVSGKVFIKLPGSTHALFEAAGLVPDSTTTGKGFVPLTQARSLPVGTEVDARGGSLRLTDATTVSKKHKRPSTQTGDFSGGLFKITQSGKRSQKGLTTMSLLDSGIFPGAPSYSQECGTVSAHVLAHKRRPLSKKVLQTLTSNEHGNFSTSGKYSAATVRGTDFSVSDRCDGTLTEVKHGVVTVTDFRRHKTITLRAHQSYLAKAP